MRRRAVWDREELQGALKATIAQKNTNIANVAFLDAFIYDLTEILNNDKAKESLKDLIDEVMKLKRDGTVTIIIDDADIAFGITKWHTAETI